MAENTSSAGTERRFDASLQFFADTAGADAQGVHGEPETRGQIPPAGDLGLCLAAIILADQIPLFRAQFQQATVQASERGWDLKHIRRLGRGGEAGRRVTRAS